MAEAVTPESMKDRASDLTKKLNHLHALVQMTFGEARDSFQSMNDEARDNYLWHCSDLVEDCSDIADQLEIDILKMDHIVVQSRVIGG